MATRNFWIDADIDGRATELSGGPRRKDGGMSVSIKQRNEGGIQEALSIQCYVEHIDGKENLVCRVVDKVANKVVCENRTVR